PEFIYFQPDTSGPGLQNSQLFPENIQVSANYQYLNEGSMIRDELINEEWARIIPERPEYNANAQSNRELYIPLTSLRTLDLAEYEPISIYEDTKHVDKLIVVVDNGTAPEMVVFEGMQVVARFPVVLGPTPHGDFRIYRTRVSYDMPGIPAVGWSLNFLSPGYSEHDSSWWAWQNMEEGGYGSHGCINLPGNKWFNVLANGQHISIAQW